VSEATFVYCEKMDEKEFRDNAPCHKSIKTTAKLHELGYELLTHPPYSPDLALSDFFFLQTSKECLLKRNLALMKR
jgi:[histone H3]-lysine36 N-dimethyltransferase SETMAR